MSKVTAPQLLELLSNKHSEDVFIPECKDGPTWYGKHFRLDAWVMNRSWSNLKFTGYEIKVSRSDFLKDNKMHEYLEYCHEAYIVCPREVLSNDEIPVDWGLMIPSKNIKKLYVVKKAPNREIEPPTMLLLYVVMCRASIRHNQYGRYEKYNFWKHLIDEKNNDRIIGQAASQKIQKIIKEKIETVENENARLKKEYEKYDEIRELLTQIGIKDISDYWSVRNYLREINPESLISNLKDTVNKINVAIHKLEGRQ